MYNSVYIAMSFVSRNGIVYCEDGEDDIITLIRSRARFCTDKRIDSKRPRPDIQDVSSNTVTSVLLRLVYFLNEERTRYVSVGFYATEIY